MDDPLIMEHPDGVTTIDAAYIRPGFAASHLIIENDHAAFVETGTCFSVPGLLTVLGKKGIARENVDYVMVTHVHLDHAGGAGALRQHLPNANLVVHPRGARHMVDPSKLVEGAALIYGREQFQSLYGEVVPVPEDRLLVAGDDWHLDLQGRPFYFFDAPGHARHHYCVFDERHGNFFAGDNFGVSYRELDHHNGPFIFPATTPVQFDPVAMHRTLDRIVAQKPRNAFLTHFGRVTDLPRLADDLRRRLDLFVELAEGLRNREESLREELEKGVVRILNQELEDHGCDLKKDEIDALLVHDCAMNAQGIETWLMRSSQKQ